MSPPPAVRARRPFGRVLPCLCGCLSIATVLGTPSPALSQGPDLSGTVWEPEEGREAFFLRTQDELGSNGPWFGWEFISASPGSSVRARSYVPGEEDDSDRRWTGTYDGRHLSLRATHVNDPVESLTFEGEASGDGTRLSGQYAYRYDDPLDVGLKTNARMSANFVLAGSSSLPPPTTLGVSLQCSHNFEDPGLVLCAAEPRDQAPDAVLSYDWSFDGAGQGVGGSELTLTGVAPGGHTVTVVVRDDANGLVSEPGSVSFTKGGSEPGTGGAGTGPDPPPLGPSSGGGEPVADPGVVVDTDDGPGAVPAVIVATVVLAGGAVAVARRKRRKPVPAPGGRPAGPPAGETPPRVAPEPARAKTPRPSVLRAPPRPATTPEPVARNGPPRPATTPEPVGRKPKPRQPAEPAATATKPSPAAATQPPDSRDRKRREGELWLEADTERVEVRGDGKAVAALEVRAWKLVNGARTDASGEVLPSAEASDEKKIHLQRGPGWFRLSIRGTHIGVAPFVGRITVSGQALAGGGAVAPIDVTVLVQPVKVEVRITAWKDGFLRQETVATLPQSCARIEGMVEGGRVSEPSGRADLFVQTLRQASHASPEHGPVAHAHCSASLQVDGGGWSGPVEVRTGSGGRFWFGVPQRMVQAYGAEVASYVLPRALDMGLNAEVRRALQGYETAAGDFEKDTEDFQAGPAYAQVSPHLAEYPSRFIEQLRKRPEEDYLKLLSAIHRLRCSILFALKYRKDFRRQRPLVNMAAEDTFGSVLNVVTDVVPIASKLYGWVAGNPLKLTFGGYWFELDSLQDILFWVGVKLQKLPGIGWLGTLLNLGVKLVRVPATYVDDVVGLAVRTTIKLARKAGLPEEYLARLAAIDPNAVDIQRLPADDSAGNSAMVQGLKGMVGILLGLLRTSFKIFCLFLHGVGVLACWGLKLVAAAVKALPWGPAYEGSVNTVGEVIEEYLGDFAGDAYGTFGSFVEGLLTAFFPLLTPPSGKGLAGKDVLDVVLDRFIKAEDLDERLAGPLQKAYDSSFTLDVLEDWQAAVSKVSHEEVALMQGWQKAAESTELVEEISAWAMLVVKVIQMFTFSAAFFAERFASVLKAALKKLPASAGSAPWAVRQRATVKAYGKSQTDALDFAGDYEKSVDILELALIRVPIFVKEVVALACVYFLAPTRIRDLYKWA